jgi:hypothetical protein
MTEILHLDPPFSKAETDKDIINNHLLTVFNGGQHLLDLWWRVPNPRLDDQSPLDVWWIDPSIFPDARASVKRVALTFETWKPEPKVEAPAEVVPTTIERTGHRLGAWVANVVHRS